MISPLPPLVPRRVLLVELWSCSLQAGASHPAERTTWAGESASGARARERWREWRRQVYLVDVEQQQEQQQQQQRARHISLHLQEPPHAHKPPQHHLAGHRSQVIFDLSNWSASFDLLGFDGTVVVCFVCVVLAAWTPLPVWAQQQDHCCRHGDGSVIQELEGLSIPL